MSVLILSLTDICQHLENKIRLFSCKFFLTYRIIRHSKIMRKLAETSKKLSLNSKPGCQVKKLVWCQLKSWYDVSFQNFVRTQRKSALRTMWQLFVYWQFSSKGRGESGKIFKENGNKFRGFEEFFPLQV